MSTKNRKCQPSLFQTEETVAPPLNLDTPVCPTVLPLNSPSLCEIDGVAIETLPLARPVRWLDLQPNVDAKPPGKYGATLARNLVIARFLYLSFSPVLVTFSKIQLDIYILEIRDSHISRSWIGYSHARLYDSLMKEVKPLKAHEEEE